MDDPGPFLPPLDFPAVQGDFTVLQMAWGTTEVPLTVTVEPTEPPVVAAPDMPM